MRLVNGVNAGMTALAGGAQPTLAANTCSGAINTVTTVATDNDSVLLPVDRVVGDAVFIFNLDSAQDIKVYPPSGGTINGASANAALVVGQTQGVIALCASDDGLTWLAMLTAVAAPA
jgi:hypothetical protein